MLIVYSEKHEPHAPKWELDEGHLKECNERPKRAKIIIESIRQLGRWQEIEPRGFEADPLSPILRVHDRD